MDQIPIQLLKYNYFIFGFELFFTLIILFSSFLIYYKTKEFYKLTEHKGIKYFRKGFLFISFAHVILFVNILLKIGLFNLNFYESRYLFDFFNVFYFIGVGYLFSSIYSKKIREYYIYLIYFFIFLCGFIFHEKFFIFIYSTILIISLGIVSFIKLKKSKKKHLSQIYIIYLLIFFSWLFNFLSRIIVDSHFIGKTINILITGLIFLYILYLVIEKLK